jgi:enoyl-[acyl-carrier protein] reductase I
MLLSGKKGLVFSVTNEFSIGWSVAKLAYDHGAEVGVGAQNERNSERVSRLLESVPGMHMHLVDFQDDSLLVELAEDVATTYGKIDFLVHSAAFAQREDLQGRFIDTSRHGFKTALDISAYSLVHLCRLLEPMFNDEASIVTMSYLGSTRVVANYNVMGVAKAALESCVRYLAQDLGPRGIRVNTISPGPINTVAARGVKGLTEMIDYVGTKAPLKRPASQSEVASTTLYLLSDLSRGVTGQVVYVDSGYNIAGM